MLLQAIKVLLALQCSAMRGVDVAERPMLQLAQRAAMLRKCFVSWQMCYLSVQNAGVPTMCACVCVGLLCVVACRTIWDTAPLRQLDKVLQKIQVIKCKGTWPAQPSCWRRVRVCAHVGARPSAQQHAVHVLCAILFW